MELNEKYVFHIPLSKYANNELIPIEIESIMDELIDDFNEKGYENLYLIDARGHYKSRSYDEVLITIFTSPTSKAKSISPDEIFKDWFERNNHILQQEAIAYECNDTLFIENLF